MSKTQQITIVYEVSEKLKKKFLDEHPIGGENIAGVKIVGAALGNAISELEEMEHQNFIGGEDNT